MLYRSWAGAAPMLGRCCTDAGPLTNSLIVHMLSYNYCHILMESTGASIGIFEIGLQENDIIIISLCFSFHCYLYSV